MNASFSMFDKNQPDEPLAYEDLPQQAQDFCDFVLSGHDHESNRVRPRCMIYGANNTSYEGNIQQVIGDKEGRTQLATFLTLMASNQNTEAIGIGVGATAVSIEFGPEDEDVKQALHDNVIKQDIEAAIDTLRKANFEPSTCRVIYASYETRRAIYQVCWKIADDGSITERLVSQVSSVDTDPDTNVFGGLQGFFIRANKVLIQGLELTEQLAKENAKDES